MAANTTMSESAYYECLLILQKDIETDLHCTRIHENKLMEIARKKRIYTHMKPQSGGIPESKDIISSLVSNCIKNIRQNDRLFKIFLEFLEDVGLKHLVRRIHRKFQENTKYKNYFDNSDPASKINVSSRRLQTNSEPLTHLQSVSQIITPVRSSKYSIQKRSRATMSSEALHTPNQSGDGPCEKENPQQSLSRASSVISSILPRQETQNNDTQSVRVLPTKPLFPSDDVQDIKKHTLDRKQDGAKSEVLQENIRELKSSNVNQKELLEKKDAMINKLKEEHQNMNKEKDKQISSLNERLEKGEIAQEELKRRVAMSEQDLKQRDEEIKKLMKKCSECKNAERKYEQKIKDLEEKFKGERNRNGYLVDKLHRQQKSEVQRGINLIKKEREKEEMKPKFKHETRISTEPTAEHKYCHHQYDDDYPDVCFLGEQLQCDVDSKGGHFAPTNLGISLEVPPNAVPAGKTITLCSRPCLCGPFQYPEGYESLSGVYLITSKSSFQKEVKLTMKHYGRIETEEQADQIYFLSAKHTPIIFKGKKVYDFRPIKGGKFAVHNGEGSLTHKQFCFLTCGTNTNIGN